MENTEHFKKIIKLHSTRMRNVFKFSLNCCLSSPSAGRRWQNAHTAFSRLKFFFFSVARLYFFVKRFGVHGILGKLILI